MLSDLSGLVCLAQERALDLRPVILRVQTDLFAGAPVRDPATIDAFEALACGLLPTVDHETAALVARKLAPLADTPKRVLRLLAGHGAEACCAVVALAPSLSGSIVEAAAASARQVAMAFASRADLDESQLTLLINQDEAAIDLALAANPALTPRGAVLARLLARGREKAAVAAALLRHPALSAVDRAPLYLHADEAQRRAIQEGIESVAALRNAPVGADGESSQRLIEAASRGDHAEFGRELASALRMTRTPQWGFDAGHRHDLLSLTLRAVGVPEQDSVTILLTLEPVIARSVGTVFRLVGLFRQIPQPSALHLVEAVTGVPIEPRTEGRRLPAFDPSGAPANAARKALPERRPAAVRPRRQA